MTFSRLSAVALLSLTLASFALSADLVDVPGSRDTKYPSEVSGPLGNTTVTMRLTGTAMRTKIILNVYAIGSYVQQDVKVSSAEELAAVDCFKRLHLVMERNV